jgi:hypothetical protein
MTLASLHLLARIKPAWTATFCGFHALAVDDTSRGSGLASLRPARALDQDTIDLPPNVTVAPIVKVVLNRREWREVLWQSAPLATGRKDIEYRIHDGAEIPFRWTSSATPLRHQSAQQNPLVSCRITCITQAIAAILFAGGFGPSHVCPWVIRNQPRESCDGAKITRFFWVLFWVRL